MKNVFSIESPRKKLLVFVTKSQHTTGTLMKQINFRNPKIIEKFKEESNLEIGDILYYENYIFVVYKKHFNSVVGHKDFKELLKKVSNELNQYKLKTTSDDLPHFKKLILEYIPAIEFRITGEWGIFDS